MLILIKFIDIFSLNNLPVDCSFKHLNELGYSWDDVIRMGGNEELEYVPMFVYQMMELFNPSDSITVYEKYWSPLFKEIIEKRN